MKKLIKWFSIFAVIGTAIGLAVAYFCKDTSDSPEEDELDFTEDEDFDLDADLQPASEREYVSLKKEETASEQDSSETAETASDKETDN